MVVEIEKGTSVKYELSKEKLHNPIMHDFAANSTTSNPKIRKLYKPIDWNYGFIPQTYVAGEKVVFGKYARFFFLFYFIQLILMFLMLSILVLNLCL